MDVMELLDAPGMAPLLEAAPLLGLVLWVLLVALLWRDGFNDLAERFTRPGWTMTQRLATLLMIPVRGVMLAIAAALGAALTTLGLLINIGVVLNLLRAGKLLLAG
ncbi:hypothetical protein [Maricaulis sp.]|uniref:hypothetical protein n=1 Tax=Maricaulis sp. TaxID=1486257 RepID=UPI003A91F62C